ncbi:S-layer homology domain-containing protein [Paenibacillus qinlingensis]|uniref:S-layer homology domain-containing protein n=1 Tax=Paenibacillus qinlingensis TaxID=1837343 RepID=UPI0015650F67|nr:S-layer homology domain-containing protein [Paenibacillus qinlingensis]NQX63674.1 S-layer homology domain-containing protein [Paenibacillus qinlingensis]
MGSVKKSLALALVYMMSMCTIGPIPHTFATANIYQLTINNSSSYLIAGQPHYVSFTTDRAISTDMDVQTDYSTDNGFTWHFLKSSNYNLYEITFPIDPQLTSAIFRVGASFSPVIGSDSYSEVKIGPYQILQPGSITDLTSMANTDGTILLDWTDNTNMESYYQITRDGPDGSKIFYVKDTMDHRGPLRFVDKDTSKYTSTIYAYSVLPVIDQFNILDSNRPGVVSVLAKTIAQKKPLDTIDAITNFPRIIEPDNNKVKIELDFTKKWRMYILDIDKVAVSSITLNKKAIHLNQGESEALIAAIIPSNAANKKMTWSSENEGVATVDNAGKVTGISPGSAKITVKAESGEFTAVCIVTVADIQKPTTATPTIQFNDIDKHWASSDIMIAVKLGAVSGYPDGTFRPDASVTRAEFTSMLMRGLKPMGEGTRISFKDNSDIEAWAVPSVELAVKLGIISGYADGTFQPNANITHAEMILMVVRASGLPTDNAQITGYADDAIIPEWAKASVSTAEKNGIIIVSGITGNKFAPQVLSNRGEAASAIVRMLKVKK